MTRVKTAVVGVGIFGDTHARAFKESEIADLVWVCDLDEAKAKRAAEKYGCKFTTHRRISQMIPEVACRCVHN